MALTKKNLNKCSRLLNRMSLQFSRDTEDVFLGLDLWMEELNYLIKGYENNTVSTSKVQDLRL